MPDLAHINQLPFSKYVLKHSDWRWIFFTARKIPADNECAHSSKKAFPPPLPFDVQISKSQEKAHRVLLAMSSWQLDLLELDACAVDHDIHVRY